MRVAQRFVWWFCDQMDKVMEAGEEQTSIVVLILIVPLVYAVAAYLDLTNGIYRLCRRVKRRVWKAGRRLRGVV